mgnify:CR=1 FL=1
MNVTSILIAFVVGAIAGLLADSVVKGIEFGMLGKIVVGILGGFIGSWLFGLLNIGLSPALGIVAQVIVAFVGALVLLTILKGLRG